MNETIKEGNWVEYVGRPNEKFLVMFSYASNKEFRIFHKDGLWIEFDKHGKIYPDDTHPIVKKTIPPKKKVLKEFDVYIDKLPTNLHGDHGTFYSRYTPVREIKAKLIVEVEE